jgi:hypothetical protein
MSAQNCAVDHDVFHVGMSGKIIQHFVLNALSSPNPKSGGKPCSKHHILAVIIATAPQSALSKKRLPQSDDTIVHCARRSQDTLADKGIF